MKQRDEEVRMEILARAVLLIAAGTFLFFGVTFLVAPVTMAAVVDIRPSSTTAISDVRAVYGGLEIGIAGLLLYAALARERVARGLAAAAVLFFGLGGGRLVGVIVDGEPSGVTLRVLTAELFAAAGCAAALALLRLRKAPRG